MLEDVLSENIGISGCRIFRTGYHDPKKVPKLGAFFYVVAMVVVTELSFQFLFSCLRGLCACSPSSVNRMCAA